MGNISCPHICVTEALHDWQETKDNWKNNDQIVSTFYENFKHTDLRSSVNLKITNDEEKQAKRKDPSK